MFQVPSLLPLLILGSCVVCATLPGHIRRNMNVSVDPCEDFYGFACGNWSHVHEGRDYGSYMEHLDHMYHKKLSQLLEQPKKQAKQEPRFVQLLRNNYLACRGLRVNYDAVQLVRKWFETADVFWMNLIKELLVFGWNRYPQEQHGNANSNESKHELPHMGERRAAFEPMTQELFKRLYSRLKPLDMPEEVLWQSIKKLESLMGDVMQYDRGIPDSVQQEQLDEREEVEELDGQEQQEWEAQKEMQVEHLFKLRLTLNGEKALAGYSQDVLVLLSQQPIELLEHYLLLLMLHRLEQIPPPRFTRVECAAQTRNLLPHAADWLLEQQLSQQQRIDRRIHLQIVFIQLQQHFQRQVLANRNKFDKLTQRFLLQKLHNMHLRLGLMPAGNLMPVAADSLTDWPAMAKKEELQLEQNHARLQLSASDYFGNRHELAATHKMWLKQQPDQFNANAFSFAISHGTYAAPFYLPTYNMLVVPQSLLAPPFYQPHQDAVYRLSSLGFLLAHEMSHALAPTVKLFDEHGNMLPERGNRLLFKSKRFDRKLSYLTVRNGAQSPEKFCDLNGIDLAYGVYMATPTAAPPRQQQQRHFFLNLAQYFCDSGEEQEKQRQDDVYGNNRDRVNDAVASLKGFALAFRCPHAKAQRNLRLF